MSAQTFVLWLITLALGYTYHETKTNGILAMYFVAFIGFLVYEYFDLTTEDDDDD